MDGRAASRGTAPSIDLRSPRQQSQSIDRYHRAIDSPPHFWCDVYVFNVSHPIESDMPTTCSFSKESAVTSVWWLLVAFVGGGCAGILLMALMRMAGDLPEQSNTCPKGWIGNDPIRLSEQVRHATDFEGARENRDSLEGRRPYKRSARDRDDGRLQAPIVVR